MFLWEKVTEERVSSPTFLPILLSFAFQRASHKGHVLEIYFKIFLISLKEKVQQGISLNLLFLSCYINTFELQCTNNHESKMAQFCNLKPVLYSYKTLGQFSLVMIFEYLPCV